MNGMEKKRIGIMGGTFDPIHMGHLIIGEKAYEQLRLDKVYFMPSGNPPHKKNRRGRATDEQRVEMVRRAIATNSHFELQLMEMHEEGYSYTYRTLEKLTRENPNTEYFFIIGADSLYTLDSWMNPQRILAACTIVVATRNHTSLERLNQEMKHLTQKYQGHFIRLDTLNIDISSQILRDWIAKRESIKYYVPDSVISYIEEQQIYHSGNEEAQGVRKHE